MNTAVGSDQFHSKNPLFGISVGVELFLQSQMNQNTGCNCPANKGRHPCPLTRRFFLFTVCRLMLLSLALRFLRSQLNALFSLQTWKPKDKPNPQERCPHVCQTARTKRIPNKVHRTARTKCIVNKVPKFINEENDISASVGVPQSSADGILKRNLKADRMKKRRGHQL